MTLAVHGPRWGAGSLGFKAGRKSPTAKGDRLIMHPVFGRHKITTRRELAFEDKKRAEWKRALDLKWKRITAARTAEKVAKGRARWEKHLAAQSVSRHLQW
jgi:hypothetical protein